MIKLNREELAWAAGFFDGEGSVPNQPGYTLAVSQTNIEPLERFQRAVFGLGKIYGPYTANRGHASFWLYSCTSFKDVQAVIALLWTFLLRIKGLSDD